MFWEDLEGAWEGAVWTLGRVFQVEEQQCKGSERFLLGILGCVAAAVTKGESERKQGRRGDRGSSWTGLVNAFRTHIYFKV